jgi:hypothetical protein
MVRLVVIVWIAALVINLPISFYSAIVAVPTESSMTTTACARLVDMDPYVQKIYQVTGRVFVFFLPLAVTWTSYAGIYWKATHSKRKVSIGDDDFRLKLKLAA